MITGHLEELILNMPQSILAAEQRIRSYVRETPLDPSIILSKMSGANVYLKCEHLQNTGAFKTRGAFNKLLSLTPEEVSRGVVTASSGNHGAGVAYALYTLKRQGRIFLPTTVSSAKLDNIKQYDMPMELFGEDTLETEVRAREYAAEHNMVYISPYNDPDIVAGQGTIGVEILRQLSNAEVVLVPIGGGGLISGIAAYLKSVSPTIQIIGCQPENSPVMTESVKQGRIVDIPSLPTLSDATSGGIESDTITFDLCKNNVDDYLLLSEDEIKNGILTFLKTHHQIIEGAAALTIAALLKYKDRFKGKNTVLILSGGNISIETLRTVLSK